MGLWQSLISGFTGLIQFFYGITGDIGLPNYGLAIIMITFVIKMILYPLSAKQMKSMKVMQKIQPQMKSIQEKYKDNPQKAQQAIMELYKTTGYNPLSGCLPLLIQMPILLAFYNALSKFAFAEPDHARFLWVPNLASPDPYIIGLPLLAALSTLIQMKVSSPAGNDPTTKSMLYVMPIMIGFMATKFPAGLALYWVVFNLVGAAQQAFINRITSVDTKGEATAK